MEPLLRESLFGRCLNYFSHGTCFPYPGLDRQQWENASVDSNASGGLGVSASAEKGIFNFLGPQDCDNPRNWPRSVKAIVMLDVMLLNFSFYAASAIFTPSIPGIEKDFNATTAEGTLGLSLFVIAYGIGPLIVSAFPRLFD